MSLKQGYRLSGIPECHPLGKGRPMRGAGVSERAGLPQITTP